MRTDYFLVQLPEAGSWHYIRLDEKTTGCGLTIRDECQVGMGGETNCDDCYHSGYSAGADNVLWATGTFLERMPDLDPWYERQGGWVQGGQLCEWSQTARCYVPIAGEKGG